MKLLIMQFPPFSRHFIQFYNTALILKVCDDGTLVQLLGFWTLTIVLSLSKNTVLFIFQNKTFRRLDSVSVFR
jgi:hypothetical protein